MTVFLKPGVSVVETDVSSYYGSGPAIFADCNRPLAFWAVRYRMTAEQQDELDQWLTDMNAWPYVNVEGQLQSPNIQFPNKQLAMLFKLKFV